MGKIVLEFQGLKIEIEKRDEEISKFFHLLTGAVIEKIPSQTRLEQAVPIKTSEKLLKEVKEISGLYNPTTKEILSYIRSQQNYKHSIKGILSYFNNREFILRRKPKEDYSTYHSVRQRTLRLHKQIAKEEGGKWKVEKGDFGLKEYVFIKE